MKTLFIKNHFKYTGEQLQPLYAYLNYKILGDSIVSWVGSCDIPFEHMVDGEDLLDQSPIRGDLMLHFIIEMFDQSLYAGVTTQRLFASLAKDLIEELNKNIRINRKGDDLFLNEGKLSISIATRFTQSAMIHFAINVTNEGTPVKTASFADLGISPEVFSLEMMKRFSFEVEDMKMATYKVKTGL